jgi:hypothetical protein
MSTEVSKAPTLYLRGSQSSIARLLRHQRFAAAPVRTRHRQELKNSQAPNWASTSITFLPGQAHPYADQSVSFQGAAHATHLGQYWQGGSKQPAIVALLGECVLHARTKWQVIKELYRCNCIRGCYFLVFDLNQVVVFPFFTASRFHIVANSSSNLTDSRHLNEIFFETL